MCGVDAINELQQSLIESPATYSNKPGRSEYVLVTESGATSCIVVGQGAAKPNND